MSEASESEADSTDGEEEGEPKEKKERRKRGSSHGHTSIPLTMDQLADAEVRLNECYILFGVNSMDFIEV